jgi:5-methyltetrahydrofolate--homocysteine methyltransferase
MKIIPDYPRLQSWIHSVGEEGLACAQGSPNASPLHLIQRDLLDATQFYYHFRDYPKEMTGLVEDLEPFFERILAVTADSPAEVIQWGANYDDMITYPALFQEHFLPWLRKASAVLKQKGKIPLSHCDGENLGLMDLIHESGIGIAESVCPYPMTKVTLAEYYRRWRPQITIFGGIPANLLLEDSASDEDFAKYMDLAFRSIVPGDHFIFGVADTVPPNAKFERLRRIGRWVEERGNLPLQAGDVRVLSAEMISRTGERVSPVKVPSKREFPEIREALAGGDQVAVQALVKKALEEGISAGTILQKGLIPAMESIGERFKEGEIFIPEVLLSARAMNEGLAVLEPFLAESGAQASGTILVGTVRGDMHDIGKNLVSVMLKGVGFKVHDLGVDVPNDVFVQKTREIHPDVLALSALLTTTMPHMQEVIAAIKRTGLREKVKIIIGGAPVNQTFADSIGADGYGGDAGDAVALVKKLLDL